MRPVNLLPARYRPARATGERPGIGYAALGVLAVLLLMIVLYVVTNNGIKDAENKTAQAQAEQQAAQARIGQLQAFGDFATLKQTRENAVRGVAQLRFDWERLMREIALVLPDETYLTTFDAKPGSAAADAVDPATGAPAAATALGPAVTVNGCAPTHQGVATTIVRLRKLHNVVDVNLQSSTRAGSASAAEGGAICPVAFAAELSFEPEDQPTVSEPVPARLGGGQ